MILTTAATIFEELLVTIEQLEQDKRAEAFDPIVYLKTINHAMDKLQSLVIESSF